VNEPTTPIERVDLIAGLLDRIEHLNEVIAQRHNDPEPDAVSIREFSARREKYIADLNKILLPIGLTVSLKESN
jgi:hypothetical protein